MAKKSPEVHTTPNPNGRGWVNQAGGDVISSHRTKDPAVARGRGEAKSRETEHVVHNKNGQIGQKNSYGPDPLPPRDKK